MRVIVGLPSVFGKKLRGRAENVALVFLCYSRFWVRLA